MTSPPSCSTLPSAQRWSAFNIFEQHWDDCMCIRLHCSHALIIAAHHHTRTNKHISVWALLRFASQQEGRMFRNISRKIVWNSHCFWALWQFCQTSTIFPLSLFQEVLLSLKKKNYEWDYTNNDQRRVQEKNQHFLFISIQRRHKRKMNALSNASTYEISTRIELRISISKLALIKQNDIGEYEKIWAVFVRKTLIRTKRQRQQIRNSQTCAAEVWRLPQALRSSTDIKTQYAVCELNSIFLYSCIPYCFSHSFSPSLT